MIDARSAKLCTTAESSRVVVADHDIALLRSVRASGIPWLPQTSLASRRVTGDWRGFKTILINAVRNPLQP
jgi:hypothetical protein